MKNKKDEMLIIKSLAKSYIDIQENQCDPLLVGIEKSLRELYPKMHDENVKDWATEFINRDPKEFKNIFRMLNNRYS